jgi:hypothetical protein
MKLVGRVATLLLAVRPDLFVFRRALLLSLQVELQGTTDILAEFAPLVFDISFRDHTHPPALGRPATENLYHRISRQAMRRGPGGLSQFCSKSEVSPELFRRLRNLLPAEAQTCRPARICQIPSKPVDDRLLPIVRGSPSQEISWLNRLWRLAPPPVPYLYSSVNRVLRPEALLGALIGYPSSGMSLSFFAKNSATSSVLKGHA